MAVSENDLSINVSKCIDLLKIIGIILIMLRHVHWFFQVPVSQILSGMQALCGELGVHIFLFCSGFGLTYSAIKKQTIDTRQFLIGRLKRIYPLYIISLVLYIFFVAKIDLLNFFFHAFFFHSFLLQYSHNPEPLWFMGVIFQLYLIYPLLFKLIKYSKLLFLITVVSSYLLNYLMIGQITEQINFAQQLESSAQDSSIFSFIPLIALGMYIAFKIYEEGQLRFNKQTYIVFFAFHLIALSIIIFKVLFYGLEYKVVYNYGKTVFPLYSSTFIIIILLFFRDLLKSMKKEYLLFVASGSFCAYLFHEFIFNVISSIDYTNSIIGIVIAIPSSIILGIIFQKNFDKIGVFK